MKIEIWSDIVCPWCYIGKRRLEAALEEFDHADAVDIEWKSFELDPSAPEVMDGSLTAHLAKKYRMSEGRAQQMIDKMTQSGADEGIDFRFDEARSGNTFTAHRLLQYAKSKGLGADLKERLMRAYFTDGVLVSDRDALIELAVEVGLDADGARAALADSGTAQAVRQDEREARDIGVSGVPFFVFGGKYGVSGAQPPERLLEVLRTTYEETASVQMVDGGGDICDEDGCAIPERPPAE